MLVLRRNNAWTSDVPSLFNNLFGNRYLSWENDNFYNSTKPDVNIKENEKDYQIELAAPGIKKSDFKIEVNKNVLTISVETESQKEENKREDNYYSKEFSYRNFSRSFNLGENLVKEDKIKAKYEDGILLVTLPKNEEAKVDTTRMIQIS